MITKNERTSQDIINAHHYLGGLNVDDVITYEQLEERLGYDVRERGYPVRKAIRRLWNDDVKFIINVRGVGYRRVTHEDAAQTLQSAPRRIRKIARTMGRKAEAIDPEQTEPETFQRTVSTAASMSVISHLTKEHQQKRLAAAAAVETVGDTDYRQLMRDSIDAMRK